VPTFDTPARFWADYRKLSAEERKGFRAAVKEFIEDLAAGKFRKGLRVKGVQGTEGVFEMTWLGGNGRATFEYGDEITKGQPHVIWRRVGGHNIFRNP
jgi:hypothetical protein